MTRFDDVISVCCETKRLAALGLRCRIMSMWFIVHFSAPFEKKVWCRFHVHWCPLRGRLSCSRLFSSMTDHMKTDSARWQTGGQMDFDGKINEINGHLDGEERSQLFQLTNKFCTHPAVSTPTPTAAMLDPLFESNSIPTFSPHFEIELYFQNQQLVLPPGKPRFIIKIKRILEDCLPALRRDDLFPPHRNPYRINCT